MIRVISGSISAKTGRLPNVELMLARCRRRRAIINPTLVKCLVFSGMPEQSGGSFDAVPGIWAMWRVRVASVGDWTYVSNLARPWHQWRRGDDGQPDLADTDITLMSAHYHLWWASLPPGAAVVRRILMFPWHTLLMVVSATYAMCIPEHHYLWSRKTTHDQSTLE